MVKVLKEIKENNFVCLPQGWEVGRYEEEY